MFQNNLKTEETNIQVVSESEFRPFRPVQYLGSKLRVLDQICDATESMVGSGATVADLFTGTSVVAQALAHKGHKVTAVDTQRYATEFANTTLGIGRTRNMSVPIDYILSVANELWRSPEDKIWHEWASVEAAAMSSGDYKTLMDFPDNLPLIWRTPNHKNYDMVFTGGPTSFDMIPLVTEIYSGSYFGVKQAIQIDQLRKAVHLLKERCELTRWQCSAALTALMSASSAAVNSAGKHFAQPLLSGKSTNVKFLSERLMKDRAVDIFSEFEKAVAAINQIRCCDEDGHKVEKTEAEKFPAPFPQDVDLYYIDPPYTAQQYSRFYHILETIAEYKFPTLMHGEALTAGLYPIDRFKSAFSAKSKALAAFTELATKASERNVSLLISYSQSAVGSNGNSRMISLDKLVEVCEIEYGSANVECELLSHRYRQFNNQARSNLKRNDSEILISCKKH